MNKIWIVSLLASSLLAVGCSDDDADKAFPGAGGGNGTGSVTAPTGKPTGKFSVTEANIALAADGVEYCAEGAKQKIDPRFKVGQSYRTDQVQLTREGTYEKMGGSETKTTVIEISENRISRRHDLVYKSVAGWYEDTCTFSSTQDSMSTKCESTALSDSLKVFAESEGEGEGKTISPTFCYMKEYSDDLKYTRNKGLYTINGGKPIEVIEIVTESTGKIACLGNDGKVGEAVPGKMYERKIISAALPEMELSPISCGNASSVFDYKMYTYADGKVADHSQFEVLEFNE